MVFQQFSGINAVLYYAPSIFADLGLSSNTTSLLATGVVGIVMLTATIPALLYIDKVGRRPILTGGAIGMGLCHFIIAVIFAKNQNQWASQSAAGWAAITFVWVFVACFGASWGPAAWILISEIWPISARPYGLALASSSNWLSNFVVGQATPDMLENITYGTFIFFGMVITLGGVFIWFFVPETSRLTLEEMDNVFGSTGLAKSDADRMAGIQREIGLTAMIHGSQNGSDGEGKEEKPPIEKESDTI